MIVDEENHSVGAYSLEHASQEKGLMSCYVSACVHNVVTSGHFDHNSWTHELEI